MAVTKSGRQLVVLANLAITSRRYKQLYRFLGGFDSCCSGGLRTFVREGV
jgi:hypothetical protein